MTFKRFNSGTGFSFVEVMVALVILSISLIILMEAQTRSMILVTRAREVDHAVTLASAKITELTEQARQKGLSSLKDDASGEFDQEKNPGFKWKYKVVKIPTPDFAGMLGMAAAGDKSDPNAKGAQNADLFAGPLQSIGKIWGEALRELRLEVTWTEGRRELNYELVTHLISPDAIGQLQGLIGALAGGAGGSPTGQPSGQPGGQQPGAQPGQPQGGRPGAPGNPANNGGQFQGGGFTQ